MKTKHNQNFIKIVGARQHNLKNIDVNIPKNKFVVISGLSGSGKSSLAFDTIYAEGQRRYVESLSSYARQFLNMMEKPDVDSIEGLSPSISIDQKTTSRNPRSTVGTVTEIYDYFRVLFARIGTPYSPETGKEIKSMSVQEIVDEFLKFDKNSKFYLISPVVNNRKGEFKKELKDYIKKGFIRFIIDNEYYESDNLQDLMEYEFNAKKIPFVKIKSFLGKELENIKYEQLIDYATPHENPKDAFRIILGDFVTTTDGTGIVHTAPTFGADDALVAKSAKPPVPPMLVKDSNGDLVPLVDLQGKFRPEMRELAGKFVKNEYYKKDNVPEKSVDVEIAIKLKTENKAFKVEKYKHSYPNCWRTDKPILYYPIDSWFIKASSFRDKMVSLNKKINWKPKSTGEGRFEKWLENVNDWNLSRSRFWGIPLPIWRTEDGKEEICIGSIEELINEIVKSVEKGFMRKNIFSEFKLNDLSDENYSKIDLHKNVVDSIILVSNSGKKMKREEDLIDVWFDSGSMPYAQWHYPFENKENIDSNKFYPADFIAEGVDQTRGWFYTLHAISTMVFDSVSYKNVISNGLVLDKHGQKMSKRLGNAIDPFKTISDYGPDATRWYMISNSNPWDNLKFDINGVDEVKRKFFGTLYNTYSFFALYANIDNFNYKEKEIKFEEKPELDRWIISELNTLISNVEKHFKTKLRN